jgi:hypothetical protein
LAEENPMSPVQSSMSGSAGRVSAGSTRRGGEFLEHLEAAVRVDDLHQLHLVELVHADDPLVVAAGRAGLAAETRRVGHHFHRQFGFGQNRVAVEIGHRHLGGGREEQVVDAILAGIGAIHVVLEFRQAGRCLPCTRVSPGAAR